MAVVDSCKCPHCETTIQRAELVNSVIVKAVGPGGYVHLLVCPTCSKTLGAVNTPKL